jgi:transcriptional regulator with XRE-family HTH domain
MMYENTDGELLKILGNRLETFRLQRNITRDELSELSGLHRNTIANAEDGVDPRLSTVIKILRGLGRLEAIDAFLPPPTVSPLQLLRLRGKPRKRARKSARG